MFENIIGIFLTSFMKVPSVEHDDDVVFWGDHDELAAVAIASKDNWVSFT